MQPSALKDGDFIVVLRNYFGDDNFQIINANIEPYFNEIKGFLGEHLRLTIELKRNEELLTKIFFVKYLPTNNEAFLSFVTASNGYQKELFIYKTFVEHARKINKNFDLHYISKLYFGENGILVLEDLSLNGYRLAKQSEIDKEHILVALKSLAKLHAISFAIEDRESVIRKKNYKLKDDYEDELRELYYTTDTDHIGYKLNRTAFNGIIEISKFLPESETTILEFQKEFSKAYEKMLILFDKPDNNYRKVLSHGDMWYNNMVFKYNNEGKAVDCTLVDFQLVRYAPPGHDATFVIYYCGSTELTRRYYYYFIEKYYEFLEIELSNHHLNIKEILPLEEYERTCKLYLWAIKMIKTLYSTLNEQSQESCKALTRDFDVFYTFLFVDRREQCHQVMKNEQRYHDVMLALVSAIKDSIYNEDINLDDCYHILNQIIANDFKINQFELKLLPQQNCYHNLIIKYTKSREEETMNFVVRKGHSSLNEYILYKKIVPLFEENDIFMIKDCIEKSYLIRLNDINVLEEHDDCACKISNCNNVQLNHVLATLKALAKFHACSLIYERTLNKCCNKQCLKLLMDDCKHSLTVDDSTMHKIITKSEEFLSNYDRKEELLSLLKTSLTNYDKLVEESPTDLKVICHGDLCLNNILFKPSFEDVENVIFTNFNRIELAHPAQDVLKFLYLTTSKNFRTQHMQNCLEDYFNNLQSFLNSSKVNTEEIITMEQFLISCKLNTHTVLVQNILICLETQVCNKRLEDAILNFKNNFESTD